MPGTEDTKTIMGRREAEGLAGANMLGQLDELEHVSHPLSRFLLEDGFGSLFADSIMEYRNWALITLASLIALGDTGDQLQVYLKAAVQHGATDDEILSVVNHACLYAGAPRAVNATRHLAGFFTGERQQRLPGVVEKTIRIGDYESAVWDNGGGGTPIVLIHALDMDHRFWRPVYPSLARLGRVIAYDLRGHGRGRGAPATTSLDQLANDTRTLLDLLNIKKADVYGASYGGAVAQYFALNHPERLRSLALLATAGKSPREALEGRAVNAEQHGMQAQVAESLIRWFLPTTIANNTWEVRYARQCVERAWVEDWAAAWRAMAHLDVLDRLKEIKVPTLVLSGKQDLSSTPAMMEETARRLPYAEYKLIDPGTHMMVMEQPESVAAALVTFRQRLDRSKM